MTAEDEVPRGHLNIIEALLGRYGFRPRAVLPVPASVLNRNYRVEADGRVLFVRIHATKRDGDRVLREHRAAAWALAHGIPSAAPLADPESSTLHRIGGAFVSLYPWVEGRTATRGALSAVEAETLGGLLGRLHVVLADYADPTLETGKVGSHWDTEEAINNLSRVDDLIRYYPAISDEQMRVLTALRHQLGLLEGGEAAPSDPFSVLERQPCHGDFHERNVLLAADGGVAAVVDWELVSLLPPVYELLRAVTFLGLLDAPARFETFLQAYRRWKSLDVDTCRAGVEMRWQAMLHDTWAYRAVYVEGNRRAAQFFAEHDREIRRFSDPAFRVALAVRLAG